jgi:hypothetical protein
VLYELSTGLHPYGVELDAVDSVKILERTPGNNYLTVVTLRQRFDKGQQNEVFTVRDGLSVFEFGGQIEYRDPWIVASGYKWSPFVNR